MKKLFLVTMVTAISLISASFSFAGSWQKDPVGYWWQEDDGSYPVNQWKEIDGKQYYFDANGYMLADTVTPDGYVVGADGAWIEGAGTQAQATNRIANVTFSGDSITQELTISDYKYEQLNYWTYHIYEITNNSQYTLEVSINETAMDGNGNPVGAKSVSQEAIPSGHTVFVYSLYDTIGINGFNASFQVKQDKYYIPVAQNISLNIVKSGDKAIVTATNNGSETVEFAKISGLFFGAGTVNGFDLTYVTDSDSELKPGSSITKELDNYGNAFDNVTVHVTGRKSSW